MNDKDTTSTNIKRDWLIAGGSIAGFFGLLKSVGWLDENYDISEMFNLIDFYMVTAKVAVASALAWTVKKLIFKNTLGKDFGTTFDIGWGEMSNVEKSRWIIAIFAIIFSTVMFNF